MMVNVMVLMLWFVLCCVIGFDIVTSCSMLTNIKPYGKIKLLSHKIKQVNVVVTYRLATRVGLNGIVHGLSWFGLAAPTTPC